MFDKTAEGTVLAWYTQGRYRVLADGHMLGAEFPQGVSLQSLQNSTGYCTQDVRTVVYLQQSDPI